MRELQASPSPVLRYSSNCRGVLDRCSSPADHMRNLHRVIVDDACEIIHRNPVWTRDNKITDAVRFEFYMTAHMVFDAQ